jgi:hypothetical protein
LFSPLISVKITRQIRSFLSILADYQMKITRQIRSFLTILAGYLTPSLLAWLSENAFAVYRPKH